MFFCLDFLYTRKLLGFSCLEMYVYNGEASTTFTLLLLRIANYIFVLNEWYDVHER